MIYPLLNIPKGRVSEIDIDIPSTHRNKVYEVLENYVKSMNGEVIRVATFGKITSKSAILTACRGVGVDSDTAKHLSSLIPVVRGKVATLNQVFYGTEEESPITEFVNICNQYPGLIETAISIEGLVNRRSIHAAGVIITNTAMTDHNAIMTAPNGEFITAWDLGESEYMGGIKYDWLNTKVTAMIQTCVQMLLEAGHMKWQGSLQKTVDHYLDPKVVDQMTPEMWALLNDGKIISPFQFETPIGHATIKKIKPQSKLELAAANTLMRLSGEMGVEAPIDRYVRYKNNINEWYQDMKDYGLNEAEIEILKEFLLHDYGVMAVQETMMLVSMSPKVSNFNVVESNKLRKAIAKAKGDVFEEVRELFYQKGLANGCRKVFLDYIWNVQIAMQKNYAFSILHCLSYGFITMQQIWLNYHFPPIYWACAVLQVESGSLEQESLDEDTHNEKTTNYGALAQAISMLQQSGIQIESPHINKAQIGFTPNETTNSIIYGLKGVSKINNEIAQTIINHRPYASFNDFVERLVETKLIAKGQLISLIKAGAFDELESDREALMSRYLSSFFKPRTTINDKFIEEVLQKGMIPAELEQELKHHYFKVYLKSLPKIQDTQTKAIKWHQVQTNDTAQDDYTTTYFETHFAHSLTEDRDYRYNEAGVLEVALGTKRKGSFEAVHHEMVQPLTQWLKSDDCLAKMNEEAWKEHRNKYAQGTKEAWEMDALSIYLGKHEVEVIDHSAHGFVSFHSLPEEAEIVGYNNFKGRQTPKYKLSRIVGCVVDKDKNKHMVSLLTPAGCVTVKFHAGNFAHYDKVISVVDPATGSKTKLEESWFKKGTLLAITGFRQGDNFKPRTYANSIVKHSVERLSFNEAGQLQVQGERTQV